MKNNLFGRFITIALVVIMASNAFILVRIRLLINTNAILRYKKISYIVPDGLTPATTKLLWDESLPAPSGWVVRYASNGCFYCKLDFEWERLAPQLELLNYRTILLLPKEENQFDENQIIPKTAQQIAFIKMDWIKQFRFTGTPTVVIFDTNGRMLWHHNGIMSNADYESAKKAITNNAKIMNEFPRRKRSGY